jgi:hypothetical protein
MSGSRVSCSGLFNPSRRNPDCMVPTANLSAIPCGGIKSGKRAGNGRGWFKGVYFIKHANHFIFKELGDGGIGVISILHESMDIPAWLRDYGA